MSSCKISHPARVKRVATLLCEIVVFKNCNDPELCEKYLSSGVSIISVYWRKDIYSGRIEKPTEWQNASAATKKKDDAINFQEHKINVRSLTASVGEQQVVDITPVWHLSTTESRLTRPIIVTWCCYNSFCLLCLRHRPISISKFFVFQQESVLRRTQRLGRQLYYGRPME